MSYKRTYFEKNQPVHILCRAVEGKKIFGDITDCYRFIFQTYAANFGSPAFNLKRADIIKASQSLLNGEQIPEKFIIRQHAPFVDILDFSLVINHCHFYFIANTENGIPLYMQKLNGGFAKYFNLKYGRKGPLFESRYKSILVKTDFQSEAVSRYISIINPLDVYQPGWREEGLKEFEESFEFLKNYQFSSFPDKIGLRNSKILASKEILEKYFFNIDDIKEKENYINFVKDFLKQNLVNFNQFFLE